MRSLPLFVRQVLVFFVCVALLVCLKSIAQARGNEDADCRVSISKADPNAPESFSVTNKTASNLTIQFLLTTARNVTSSPALPQTWVMKPHATEDLFFSIHPANPRSAWRYECRYYWRNGRQNSRHDDSHAYRLPFESGKSFRVIQGYNGSFSHRGEYQYCVDWDMPTGSLICAARGRSRGAQRRLISGRGLNADIRDHINIVLILHEDKTIGEMRICARPAARYSSDNTAVQVSPSDILRMSAIPTAHISILVSGTPLPTRRSSQFASPYRTRRTPETNDSEYKHTRPANGLIKGAAS